MIGVHFSLKCKKYLDVKRIYLLNSDALFTKYSIFLFDDGFVLKIVGH